MLDRKRPRSSKVPGKPLESLPALQPSDQIIAVLVSDLHLSLQKPSCRAEEDWLEVQRGYLKQISDLVPAWDVPIICGGDVFDRWNAPAELINFCIDHLPEMWVVPGQHDLPFHSYGEWERSGLCTLAKIGKVKLLTEHPQTFVQWNGWGASEGVKSRLFMYGFGWGKKIVPPLPTDETIHLAVCHRYVWSNPGNSYPNAPESGRLRNVLKEFKGYDAILLGDNHRSLNFKGTLKGEEVSIINPGTFMRRKVDEIDHKPCVGLLKADGSIEKKYLDVSGDKFVQAEGEKQDFGEFVDRLKEMGECGLSFEEAVQRAMEDGKASEGAKRTILEAMQ